MERHSISILERQMKALEDRDMTIWEDCLRTLSRDEFLRLETGQQASDMHLPAGILPLLLLFHQR